MNTYPTMLRNYVLDENGEPKRERDIFTWAAWYAHAERCLREDTLGDVRVGTVFLGADHQFGDGPPILWETMIFGGPHDKYQERYTTKAEALAGHQRALALVRTGKAG